MSYEELNRDLEARRAKVLKMGKPEVLERRRNQGLLDARQRPVDMLVPFVSAHVHRVDLAARRIDTDWPTTF